MENFIALVTPMLQHIGVFGYLVVFAVTFTEAVAFIGSFIPGGTILTIAGFFAAQGYFSFAKLLTVSALGVMLGDGLSFWLGSKSKRLFKEKRFLLNEKNLEKGRKFFEKHGGRSILFGRFIAPVRSVIPFVAGASKMDKWEFTFWMIIGGILWSLFHIVLGFFFSGTIETLGMWSTRVGVFVAAIIVGIIILQLMVRFAHPIFEFLGSLLKSIKEAILENPDVKKMAKKHPKIFAFLGKRLDTGNFTGMLLTSLLIAFVYILSVFAGTVEDVVTNSIITGADLRVENLVYSFRNTDLIKFFLWVTTLANVRVIIVFATILSLILWVRRKKEFILPFWVTLSGSTLFYTITKLIVHRPRPELAYYAERGFSFPSGHSTIAVAFYGFVAYILFRRKHHWKMKANVVFWGLLTILAIGFSRIYLCVHYLSDVMGGYMMGALWLIIGIILSEWLLKYSNEERQPASRKAWAASIVLAILGISFYAYAAYTFRPVPNNKAIIQDKVTTADIQTMFNTYNLSKYSETLYGNPMEPVSLIMVADNDEKFVSSMKEAGWSLADQLNVSTLIEAGRTAMFNEEYQTAPITPSFWNAQTHDFGFQKPTSENSVRSRHHARFWRTNVRTEDGKNIYVGTTSLDVGIKWYITHRISPDIDTERELVLNDLETIGAATYVEKIQLVAPLLGKNFARDQFFTDGKAYIIYFK